MKIGIIGQGYVGTSLAIALCESGFEIIGIENSQKRIQDLHGSKYPVLRDTSVLSTCDVVVIAVPTPLDVNKKPDLSFLIEASNEIKKYANPGSLIINESTSYPGTLRNLIAKICGNELQYAVAPERIDPGNNKWNIRNTPRIVGALSEQALDLAFEFYSSITNQVFKVSSPEVAEAAKLFENTFRHVNIALINEFAQINHKIGISTIETVEAASTKPFGFMPFYPSVGVGGHCIPIDPVYLSFAAKDLGFNSRFIDLASEVNLNMPKYVSRKLVDMFNLKGKQIQIAGIAYKPNTSDTRESPAIELIKLLRQEEVTVIWNDDLVQEYFGEKSSIIQPVDLGIICAHHDVMDYSPWIHSNTRVIDVGHNNNLPFPKLF